eukprot:Tbor_TRINITY_DN1016_c0_g1::TRINITY_DN1016_c0_g1_i1::g.12378::m.12378/K04797/pfdA, PFDN5; prefoldin alpha subunit
MSQKQQEKGLNLANLSFDQLQSLKKQLDEDIQSLGRAYDGLRVAKNRFQESKGCLETFKAYEVGQKILVPMTHSLYIEGEIADNEKVLVDVGTGYYFKQPINRAQEFFVKRVSQMQESMDGIANNITQKQKQQNIVIDVMQQKAQIMQGAQ